MNLLCEWRVRLHMSVHIYPYSVCNYFNMNAYHINCMAIREYFQLSSKTSSLDMPYTPAGNVSTCKRDRDKSINLTCPQISFYT